MQPEYHLEITDLLGKYLRGEELTAIEIEKINSWTSENEKNAALWKKLKDPLYVQANLDKFWNGNKEVHWNHFLKEVSAEKPVMRIGFRNILKYAAIVVSLALAGTVIWYFIGNKKGDSSYKAITKNAPQKKVRDSSMHITLKGNVAQLVMGDGKVVNLNKNFDQSIIEQDGTKLSNRSSELSYINVGTTGIKPVDNTLITPRGGTYQVKLSDGTNVWLNSASTLRYPTQFDGKERRVYLTGEAYFEVARDTRHPFIVNAGKMNITVLGTKFNVSSYPDEPVQKTTLFKGSVRVKENDQKLSKDSEILLKPGYEAVIRNNNPIMVAKAKIDNAVAWKEHVFVFDSQTLGCIMRKLSREYDVKVIYENGADSTFHFSGRIKMYNDINDVLDLLELTGKVKFEIKNEELLVKPGS